MAQPVTILVRPQLGENIGMATRAMLNCGAKELRIVAPRDGWPSESALAASAGAIEVINQAKLFDNVADAVADLNFVFAATARPRNLTLPVVTPEEAAVIPQQNVGILFGPENSGLNNDDLAYANSIITVPLNPEFSSLNLSQGVLLVLYQFWDLQKPVPVTPQNPLANKQEIQHLFQNLTSYLAHTNYFRPPEKASSMQRNLLSLLMNANLNSQQVRTLQGAFRSLYNVEPQQK